VTESSAAIPPLDAEVGAVARSLEAVLNAPSPEAQHEAMEHDRVLLRSSTATLFMAVLLAQLWHNGDRSGAAPLKQIRALLVGSDAPAVPDRWFKPCGATSLLGSRRTPWIDAFTRTLIAWVDAPTYRDERRALEAHLDLLDPPSDVLLFLLAKTRSEDPVQERLVQSRRRLLRRIIEQGGTSAAIRDAYINAHGGLILDLPPWLDEVAQQIAHWPPDEVTVAEALAWVDTLRHAIIRAQQEPDLAPESLAEVQIALWDALDVVATRDHDPHTVATYQEEGIISLRHALVAFPADRYPDQCARIWRQLGAAFHKRRSGSHTDNVEEALTCFQVALRLLSCDENPEEFASVQLDLGNTLQDESCRVTRDHIETALACYHEALRVYSADTFPYEYALVQHNLGAAFQARLAGQRRENIEQAITSCEAALQIYRSETYPEEYARAQRNLGNAYSRRIAGARHENREMALACYQAAMRIFTREKYPADYARSLVGQADMYEESLVGERWENRERARQCYEEALTIYTYEEYPHQYAHIQNNLGICYVHREVGDQTTNLEQAVSCFREALRIYLFEDQPDDYALAQANLGGALDARTREGRLLGHQLDSEEAIRCYHEALRVYTRTEAPASYASCCFGLGNVYAERVPGQRQENIELAMLYYQEALQVYTRDDFPVNFRDTQLNVAWLAFDALVNMAQEAGDLEAVKEAFMRAHAAFTLAREVQSELGWLESDERGRANLQGEYRATRDLSIRDAWCLLELGDLRGALRALEAGRAQAIGEHQAVVGVTLDGVCPAHASAFVQAKASLRQVRATDDRSARRAARDAFLAARQAIRDHCRPDFLPNEVSYQEIATAAAPDQALLYLAASDRGGFALVLPPQNSRGNDGSPTRIPLPLLTWQAVDDWLARPDEQGWIVGGLRLALDRSAAEVLRHWALRPTEPEEQRQRFATPLAQLPELLSASLSALQEALLRLLRAWERTAESLVHGDTNAQQRAEVLRARPAMRLRDALETGLLARELGWYIREVELEILLPQLSAAIIRPLRAGLAHMNLDGSDQSIALIACGRLSALPLHAAGVQEAGADRDLPFQETCELAYQASARSLAAARVAVADLPQTGPFVTIGNPQPTTAAALPFALREAREIVYLARRAGRRTSQALVTYEATRKRVVDVLESIHERLSGAWVEIASHGHASAFDANQCFMVLANNERLTLADLQHAQVLAGVRCFAASGCVTALGDLERAPDELGSFAAGLLQAGAASALATLWAVHDHATALLMLKFAEHILADPQSTPARALRAACKWLRTASVSSALARLRASSSDDPAHTFDGQTTLDSEEAPLRGVTFAGEGETLSRWETVEDRAGPSLQLPNTQWASPMSRIEETPYAHPIYWASFVAYGV